MSIPHDVRLRPGSDPRYLNIDVAGGEIGYLYLAPDGAVVRSWADDVKNRDLVTLVSRCYTAAVDTLAENRAGRAGARAVDT